jgi:hypothetical protein
VISIDCLFVNNPIEACLRLPIKKHEVNERILTTGDETVQYISFQGEIQNSETCIHMGLKPDMIQGESA